MCLFSASILRDLIVCERVQSCNGACVLGIQMPALTTNQQFGSSVTRPGRIYMCKVGLWMRSFMLKVILTASHLIGLLSEVMS